MNIIQDKNPGAYAIRVQCLTCFAMGKLADMYIDTDGPAFKAYYHLDCIPKNNEPQNNIQ